MSDARLKPYDVVQIRPHMEFEGRNVGLSVVMVVSIFPGSAGCWDLLLVDKTGFPILATTDDVTFIRHGNEVSS